MPNWCSSSITFVSNNETQIKNFYNRFMGVYEDESTRENGFGKGWLGDFINVFLGDEICSEDTDIRHRGSVEYVGEIENLNENEYSFSIQTETAWVAMMRMWKLIIDKHYPDIEIFFIAEECGMDYYVTNDDDGRFYWDKFKLEYGVFKDDDFVEYTEYYCSEESLRNEIKKIFGSDFNEIDIENLNEYLSKLLEERDEKGEEWITIGIYMNPQDHFDV